MHTLHPAFFAGPAPSRITHSSISNRHNQHAAPALALHSSLITRHCRSNRHTPRLENAISHRKQTLDTRSNRQFLQVSASHQRRIANADRPPQVPSKIVSNRQWQILEITKNPIKTHLLVVLIDTKTRYLHLRFQESDGLHRSPAIGPGWGSGTRFHAPRKRPVSRAGTFWGLCGSQRSANAGLRSFRSGCRKAPGR